MTNSTANLFEMAVRNKYRFAFKGMISVEDLWDLSVNELDTVFKTLNKDFLQSSEESLLQIKTQDTTVLENKIKIVKYIVEIKVSEAAAKRAEKAQKEQRERILEILASKQEESLQNKTPEELLEMLENLEA